MGQICVYIAESPSFSNPGQRSEPLDLLDFSATRSFAANSIGGQYGVWSTGECVGKPDLPHKLTEQCEEVERPWIHVFSFFCYRRKLTNHEKMRIYPWVRRMCISSLNTASPLLFTTIGSSVKIWHIGSRPRLSLSRALQPFSAGVVPGKMSLVCTPHLNILI